MRFKKRENIGYTRLFELTSLGRNYVGRDVNTNGTEKLGMWVTHFVSHCMA
jgi:hypothetical protein